VSTSEETEYDLFEGNCAGCGIGMTRKIPKSIEARYAGWWRDAEFWCDDCAARQEEERRQEETDGMNYMRLRNSGLPERRQHRLNTLDHPEYVLDACRAWVKGDIQGLMLTGSVGTGKTTLAGAAVFEMLHTRLVLWAPLGTFFARLSLPFGEPGREWATRVIDGSSALALDDLDKARNSEYGREQVFTAIDHRIEEGLPLVITSNMDPDEISQRFGEAVGSRIAGCCAIVKVEGEDRRLRGGTA
jgi:DNA replication protein DnaC